MTFVLLPAVDVAAGRAVRLLQGDRGTEPTDHGDARAAALAWQEDGAEWIHLVDLDAAFGRGSNAELLASVIGNLDVAVELAGGIRDDHSLEWAVSTDCARVVLATTALDDPAWCARAIAVHGRRIAVGLDVRGVDDADGTTRYELAPRGGTGAGGDLWETLALLDDIGCARYVVTDVRQDGTLRGPNLELYRAVTRATATPVIASGGIATLDDLVAVASAARAGAHLEGSIVGTALVAGRFTLPQALDAVRWLA